MTQDKSCFSCFEPSKEAFDLPEIEGWPAQRHQFDEESIWAIQAAMATGRPLLVRGEPGTGKSQLARAAAHVMNRPFLYEVVTSHTEVTDLLWSYDAVARLGEAQILGAGKADMDTLRKELAPERFISPGKVWLATDWPGAEKQAGISRSKMPQAQENGWRNGCVLLVDEIDKADSELPNALLECFANQSFQIMHRQGPVRSHPDQPPPLVVVTTNEERELPAPFLRRCLVLQFKLEEDEKKLEEFLIERGKVHFETKYKNDQSFEEVLKTAALELIKDRKNVGAGAISKPGQAEYLDLCRAVFQISHERQKPASEILAAVAKFALRKNPL
jgi:MoxR-like ATPase